MDDHSFSWHIAHTPLLGRQVPRSPMVDLTRVYGKAGIKGTVVYSTRAPAFTIMSRFGSRPAPDTRGVEAFLKKTAIAYGGDPSKKAKFCGMQ